MSHEPEYMTREDLLLEEISRLKNEISDLQSEIIKNNDDHQYELSTVKRELYEAKQLHTTPFVLGLFTFPIFLLVLGLLALLLQKIGFNMDWAFSLVDKISLVLSWFGAFHLFGWLVYFFLKSHNKKVF